jgi:hypothetical protein
MQLSLAIEASQPNGAMFRFALAINLASWFAALMRLL